MRRMANELDALLPRCPECGSQHVVRTLEGGTTWDDVLAQPATYKCGRPDCGHGWTGKVSRVELRFLRTMADGGARCPECRELYKPSSEIRTIAFERMLRVGRTCRCGTPEWADIANGKMFEDWLQRMGVELSLHDELSCKECGTTFPPTAFQARIVSTYKVFGCFRCSTCKSSHWKQVFPNTD